jgi:formate dehydrogenase alpha subunit
MTNSMDELAEPDCILVIGSNTTEAHPIVALRIKAAVAKGTKLIVADPRKIDLVRFASQHMRQRSGTDVALINAMLQTIISEELYDREFVEGKTENFDEVRECVAECTPEWAESISGVPADEIRTAARAYAGAERASIVYSMGITQHVTGTDNVLALANLAMLTGNVGKRATGVNPLRGQNNVQGACDLGALPNVYPGYQQVTDDSVREKFEKAWSTQLSPQLGLTIIEMLNAAEAGELKALYVMGENPVLSDPNSNHAVECLKKLELLVVQDIFLSETAQLADVVLPAAAFAEKDGSFTNTERRVQLVRKAVEPPGEAREDWDILCDLARRMGYEMAYEGASRILDEIASLSPIYGGMSFERIAARGLQWPCPDAEHPGTVFLHEGQFKRGKGKFHPTPFREAAELPDEEYPMLLTTGRQLYQFHTGTMTRKSSGIEICAPAAPVEISPADAESLSVSDGDSVRVASRRGEVVARAVVTERSPVGTVFMPFHFHEAGANVLTNDALDPIAKIPELKVCAVRLEKAD